MHILLVNDDGIHSEGLRQMARAAMDEGHRVTVCAPDRERSAASHSLSIATPLCARETDVLGAKGYAINGTPADCARLGMYLTRDDAPDFAISGINNGQNTGGACVYSGTVGAAMEASMTGCPALASSMRFPADVNFEYAAQLTLKVVKWALEHPLPHGAIYNLNVPCLPKDEIRGLKLTQVLSPSFISRARYQEFISDYRRKYYFLTDGEPFLDYPEDSDDQLNKLGWATLSALTWDIALKSKVDDIDFTI